MKKKNKKNMSKTQPHVKRNKKEEKKDAVMNCSTPEVHTENNAGETAPQPETNTAAGTDNAAIVDMLSPENLSALIPKDERAVTETDRGNQNKPVIVSIIEPEDINSKIPEEEREVADEDEKPKGEHLPELTEATKTGYFSPARGMKGFITDTGHTFFAKIYLSHDGERFLDYIQRYNDGTFSASMRIKQADLLLASMYHFASEEAKDGPFRSEVNKFLMNITRDYYGKLLYPNEGLDTASILNLLVSQYDSLPVETEPAPLLERPRDLYAKVIETINEKWSKDSFDQEAYYALDDFSMDALVYELDIPKKTLLKKLKEYHLLYLAESSKGYQTCVRLKPDGEFQKKSYTQWCYCILNLEYIAKADAQKRAGKKTK